MKTQFRLTCGALILGVTLTSSNLICQIKPAKPPATDLTKVIKTKTNINTADAKGIALLPGVDGETARKIVAGRPYKSLSDLAGVVPADVLAGIKPLIVLDADTDANVAEAAGVTRRGPTDAGKLDINQADWVALSDLPGIDADMAKRIVGARPYKSVSDLRKVVPGDVLRQISGLIEVGDTGKVDVNKADVNGIALLPGVDGETARKIVEGRPYKSLEDLREVVPADVLAGIKPLIVFDRDTDAGSGRGLSEDGTEGKLDINQADWVALSDLPGIDADMAKRIVGARPYKSVSDLRKVVPGDVLRKIAPLIEVGDTGKVNVNTGDAKGIALLPGIDGETARKIVEGRPYKSLEDLREVVPADVLAGIKPLIVFDRDTDAGSGRGLSEDGTEGKLDINQADWVALSDLPGIDADMAKRIVGARPYKSVSDLRKVVPGDVLRKIAPLIEVGDTGKVNVNTADAKGIALLPGIDGETARKIVAGRPYQSLADLGKVIPEDELAMIKGLIVFGLDSDVPNADGTGRGLSGDREDGSVDGKLDINKADANGIALLPGLDGETARQIVAARPYKSLADLAKVVPGDVLDGLKPLICIDGRPVWTGPPIDADFTADGTLLIELHAPTSGYELRLDDIMVSDGVVTVQCTMTTPGAEEITNDLPAKHPVRVKRSRLANEASQVAVTVATVQRGAQYIVAPAYVTVASLSMAVDK